MKHIDLRNKRGSAADKALNPNERDLLRKKVTDVKDRIILLLGCYAGLRAEEIAQCRFSWFEWVNFKDTKVLTVTVPAEDKNTRIPYKKFKQKRGKWANTSIYIFDNEVANEIYFYYVNNKEGLKMSRQNITTYRVKPHFSKLLGIEVTTHALRSTYTNYITKEFKLNGERLEPAFVKTQLRHTDFKTTMKHYNTENKAQQQAYLRGVLE